MKLYYSSTLITTSYVTPYLLQCFLQKTKTSQHWLANLAAAKKLNLVPVGEQNPSALKAEEEQEVEVLVAGLWQSKELHKKS